MSNAERDARRTSLGGSDARIIMSGNQHAIERLWLEKRGEEQPEDLSDVLLVQLGNITEPLHADWFEEQTSLVVTDEQKKVFYKEWEFAHSTLDGYVRKTADGDILGIVEFKFMLPFGFSVEAAVEKYFPQCQHNMMVTDTSHCWLSIMTGAGGYHRVELDADIFYQVKLLESLRDFWECVQNGNTPGVPDVAIPAIERVKIIDMSTSNEWMAFAADIIGSKTIADKHDKAKKEIKKLMPQDAAVAEGGGVKIHLSKDGKQLFKLDPEAVAKADNDSGVALLQPPAEKAAAKKKAPTRKKAAASPEAEAA